MTVTVGGVTTALPLTHDRETEPLAGSTAENVARSQEKGNGGGGM